MQVCTDGGAESRTIVQEYRATDYRATFYHQHLGYACQRQLRTYQYSVRRLCLLDFASGIGAARDRLLRMMFQIEERGRVGSILAPNQRAPQIPINLNAVPPSTRSAGIIINL
jgi:hypothetical protein